MVDVEGGNNMMYLPLDKLAQQGVSSGTPPQADVAALRRELEQLRRDLGNNRSGNVNRLRNN
jgi:membrane protease subunit HflK